MRSSQPAGPKTRARIPHSVEEHRRQQLQAKGLGSHLVAESLERTRDSPVASLYPGIGESENIRVEPVE
jgi:hypothetical protein